MTGRQGRQQGQGHGRGQGIRLEQPLPDLTEIDVPLVRVDVRRIVELVGVAADATPFHAQVPEPVVLHAPVHEGDDPNDG